MRLRRHRRSGAPQASSSSASPTGAASPSARTSGSAEGRASGAVSRTSTISAPGSVSAPRARRGRPRRSRGASRSPPERLHRGSARPLPSTGPPTSAARSIGRWRRRYRWRGSGGRPGEAELDPTFLEAHQMHVALQRGAQQDIPIGVGQSDQVFESPKARRPGGCGHRSRRRHAHGGGRCHRRRLRRRRPGCGGQRRGAAATQVGDRRQRRPRRHGRGSCAGAAAASALSWRKASSGVGRSAA